LLVFCPSNPFVSIGPILAVPGVRDAIQSFSGRRIAVSPIIGGQAVKGPAAKMFAELGERSSALTVAQRYQGLCDVFVLDEVDAELVSAVSTLGVRALVAPTLMVSEQDKIELARRILAIGEFDA
jgi:LPPG:FO 2-phospho-L-lactate transferase